MYRADKCMFELSVLLLLQPLWACAGSRDEAPQRQDDPSADTGDPSSGDVGNDADCADGCPGDSADPQPMLACPPSYALPEATGCDGLQLLDPQSIEAQSEGIVAVPGPMGAAAVRLDDGQSIDIRDDACLQLGRDGAAFSISLWFRMPDADNTLQAALIGTGNSSGSTDGFTLYAHTRAGQLQLGAISGGGPGTERLGWSGPGVEPGVWNHVAMTYRNASNFRVLLNGQHFKWEAPDFRAFPEVHTGELRLGDPGHGDRAPVELSEVRSYQRVLNDSEIRALYLGRAESRGLSAQALDAALVRLTGHFQGAQALAPGDFDEAVAEVVRHAALLPTRKQLLQRGLDLIDAYESKAGPLFVSEATEREIARAPVDGEATEVSEARSMLAVHQAVLDHGFNQEAVAGCADLFEGRLWQTSSHFPGAVQMPVDLEGSHTVPVDATKPAVFGRPVAFAMNPARRPTGLYLPPGSVGRVTVPPSLTNRGYAVLVGAHSHSQDSGAFATRAYRRMVRVARRFQITREVTTIANPLGGGVYIEVPYLGDAGMVEITVSGVVQAPLFSLRHFDRMTADQWRARRTAPGPWADFVTDRFMLQVPRHWVYAIDDPTPLMEDYDRTMDGVTEVFGLRPEERNDVVLYMQTDVWIRSGMGGIGYPQINLAFNPSNVRQGDHGAYLLHDTTHQLELHELGHAQLVTKFPGETEALVNFPMAYVLNQKFGVDFDRAFGESGPHGREGGAYTVDQAAVHWMITENFRSGREMDRTNSEMNQMRYQHRGYAKYADIARLFGWEALIRFFRQEHLDHELYRIEDRELHAVDDRILRMSKAVDADLTPLIHFWGTHPVDPDALRSAIADSGLGRSSEVQTLLRRYRELIPADNDGFNAHFEAVYPGRPEGGNPNYGLGWYNVWRGMYDASHGQRARAALDALLSRYYP